jgi:hypothetical protein
MMTDVAKKRRLTSSTKGQPMNDGVALLLERMKTNPEEFVVEEGVVAKWDSLVRSYESILPPEDFKAYKDARDALLQQQFTEKVMEELVDPKKSDNWADSVMQAKGITLGGMTTGHYNTAIGYKALQAATTTTINANSLTLGNTTLDESTLEHMKAHLEAIYNQKPKKEHKTLFGKLFNYQ